MENIFMSQPGENFKKFPVIFPVIREFGPGLFSWATNIKCVGWALFDKLGAKRATAPSPQVKATT
jgi:hypothetical protein